MANDISAPTTDFSITTFISNLAKHNEVARADKWDVSFMVPTTILNGDIARELTLQCEVGEMPSRDINMIEYRHYGFVRRIPHQNQYGVAAFTFYVSGDMWEKRLFDRWLDAMIPSNSGLVVYPMDSSGNHAYECDIFVNQYDSVGNQIYYAQLVDCIPITVSQISTDWNNDQPHRVTVTFAFVKWLSDSTINDPPIGDFGADTGATSKDPSSQDGVNNYTNANQTPKTDQRT